VVVYTSFLVAFKNNPILGEMMFDQAARLLEQVWGLALSQQQYQFLSSAYPS
jgi:hypothetical protein